MGHEGNGRQGFHVIISGALRLRLEELVQQSEDPERFLSDFTALMLRRRDDPYQVGEPLFHYPNLELLAHLALAGRIKIEFNIHDRLPIVWLTAIDLL